MKAVLCVFHLKGTILQVAMFERDAKIYLRDWKAGLYKGRMVGDDNVDLPWALNGDDLTAIQIAHLQQQEVVEERGVPTKIGPGTSGVQK